VVALGSVIALGSSGKLRDWLGCLRGQKCGGSGKVLPSLRLYQAAHSETSVYAYVISSLFNPSASRGGYPAKTRSSED
jgi:hypothetical protein